ncbi:hypothetical protein H0I23_08505 [Cellulophaga sp. HaHaR_3_176]|uniref:hypothetical protein n=1 Tax=Cellulophaga sp. HaHaR_3_176 TaxID=1942464 RepID=UPI001C1FABE8|nr:hypothetical protein [Cellulophaga sp. HaHaR_3_176]QWX82518.1 hypothetical protein H0I23_08505 [Cellulophaga sp. HaHaR_3_176]
MIKYFNIDGISTNEETDKTVVTEWNNQFSIKNDDISSDMDFKLINLTFKSADILFGSVQNMYNILMTKSTMTSYAGINAEIKISKDEFEKWLNVNKSTETHKFLYYYDFQSLVGSLQNLISESRFLLCDFYKTLNENSFMIIENPKNVEGLMFASGRLVTSIFAKINHLFINLNSQLDFITKIAYELENIPKDFDVYPKMKSNKILFGDAKKIKNSKLKNTIFDKTDNTKLIISLRNEIIHNASFENIQKVYQLFSNNIMTEKFILIPDNTNGNFDSYKNRNRFFNNDIKLNELLPNIVTEFWKEMETTIIKLA